MPADRKIEYHETTVYVRIPDQKFLGLLSVNVCRECGSMVFDKTAHTGHHKIGR